MDLTFFAIVGSVIFSLLFAALEFTRERGRLDVPVEPLPEPRETPVERPQEPGTVPVPVPVPVPPSLKWDTVKDARHSVRVICDEEGLSVKDKNDLCATVGAESGWQSYYLSGPKKGQPVKLDNIKDGVVWSTDWGIAQINSYWHIGKGKTFPSSQFVLDNPEKCIRWMCKMWKAGHKDWWIAYKNGNYKKFL